MVAMAMGLVVAVKGGANTVHWPIMQPSLTSLESVVFLYLAQQAWTGD